MTEYYVTHPGLDLSATVYAPTTEKARTTFLDFLERSGRIPRASRGRLREDLVAERMKGADTYTDIELYYGYQEPSPEPEFRMERSPMEIERPSVALGGFEEPQITPSPVEEEGLVEVPIERESRAIPRMPIQEVALGGQR